MDTADSPREWVGVQDSGRERGWLMEQTLRKYECRRITRILGRNNS